jgi:hypothetical protein
MKPTEIREELDNAAIFMQGMIDNFHYSDCEIEEIHSTIRGIYEAINLIDKHLINKD